MLRPVALTLYVTLTLYAEVVVSQMVRVRIVANPANDLAFTRRAELLAERCNTPEELERSLRADYDRARVVRGVTDVVERWYAYRDGSWRPSNEQL